MNDRSSTRQRRLQTSTASGSGGAKQATMGTAASSTASTSGVPRYLQRTPAASSGQALIPYKTFSKQQLKLLLRDIIGIEWMNQSGAKSPINLSQGLKSLIQTVTALTDEDLQLLWSPPPKTPAAVLKQIDHALPATIDAPLMQKLESIKLNAVVQQKLPVTKKKAKPAASGSRQSPSKAQSAKEQEKLIKAIMAVLEGKKPKEKDQTTEAFKKTVKAFFKTEEGKKIKEKALDALLSKKGLPFTLIVGSGVLAGMIANNTDIPSTPEIPLGDEISLKFEFEGTFQEPKGIKLTLKFSFGGPKKTEKKSAQPPVTPLPAGVYTQIATIDNDLIHKWALQKAYWEYEIAGPEQEAQEQEFYKFIKKHPSAVPEARILAEHLARSLMELGIKNRVHQLKGESFDKRLVFDMHYEKLWNEFYALNGLTTHLNNMVRLLLPVVPFKGLGITSVEFVLGKHTSFVSLKD